MPPFSNNVPPQPTPAPLEMMPNDSNKAFPDSTMSTKPPRTPIPVLPHQTNYQEMAQPVLQENFIPTSIPPRQPTPLPPIITSDDLFDILEPSGAKLERDLDRFFQSVLSQNEITAEAPRIDSNGLFDPDNKKM